MAKRFATRTMTGIVPGGDGTKYDSYWTESAQYVICRERGGVHVFVTPELERVELLSVNGAGEIRWKVEPRIKGDYLPEDAPAVKFFGLQYARIERSEVKRG